MRVAVYHNNRDIRLEERPRPTIGPGELLMRVEASGVCGSDVMEWYRVRRAPLVLGHEVAGEVVAVGDGVTAFAPGDRICTTHHVPCGACRYCETDRHSVCETLRTTSFDPGGFAEYIRLPALNVARGTFVLPDDVSYEEGSFVEPLACTVRAQRLARMERGQSVAVLGSGISGVLQMQLAKANGAGTVVATDLSDWRLARARGFGADVILRADDDVPARIREATDGRGAELVIVCTGALAAIEHAFASVDLGGMVMIFAPANPGVTWPFPLQEIWSRGISVTHTYAGPPADMRAALDLIARRKVDVASMVTHRVGLADTAEAFRLTVAAGESLKVMVEPQR